MTQPSSAEADSTGPHRRPRVLIVGATGFLGAKILRELERDESVAVRTISRRGVPAGASPAVEWLRADLMDPVSLDAALSGVDIVVSSANGYMKETIQTDFQGNRNLIEAASRARVKRFVFLSIVACDMAPDVPHFHAKKVAEDLIKASGLPYVMIRAPAFLDQSPDYVADGVRAGRYYAVGDRNTRWSYVLTDDLAESVAKAATFPDETIASQTIDVGWSDGARSQQEIAALITQVTGRSLSIWVVPWLAIRVLTRPVKLVSELGYDLMKMFLFFRTGRFVADTTRQDALFGRAPTALEAITRWARRNGLLSGQPE
ncbi:SDR family oxidoreductase [Alsobacter sp. R-9]